MLPLAEGPARGGWPGGEHGRGLCTSSCGVQHGRWEEQQVRRQRRPQQHPAPPHPMCPQPCRSPSRRSARRIAGKAQSPRRPTSWYVGLPVEGAQLSCLALGMATAPRRPWNSLRARRRCRSCAARARCRGRGRGVGQGWAGRPSEHSCRRGRASSSSAMPRAPYSLHPRCCWLYKQRQTHRVSVTLGSEAAVRLPTNDCRHGALSAARPLQQAPAGAREPPLSQQVASAD